MNNHEDEFLTLSLSLSINNFVPPLSSPPLQSPLSPPFTRNVNGERNTTESNVALLNYGYMNNELSSVARTRVGLTHARTRKTSRQSLKERNKSDESPITPPYPWATTRRAIVHSLDYLVSNGITVISGEVQCKKCDQQYQILYDLQEKFKEIATFIGKTKSVMHDRAPTIWMNPNLPNCKYCNQNNCVKPIISDEKTINWLFLLLGQTIGCCKLNELKYFCKYTKNHRTGAKDRLVYLTYMELCKQLDPQGSF